METECSTRSSTVEDQPVSTALSLCLFPTPVAAHRQAPNPRVVDLSAVSIWCFNLQETHQEPPLLALPNHQETHCTISTALSLFPFTRIKDYLPTKNSKDLGNFAQLIDAGSSLSLSLSLPMKRKTQINLGPGPKKPIKNPRDLGNFSELIDAASSFSLSLPTKRKRLIIIGPRPKKPENCSHLTIKPEEGVAKKQKVDNTRIRLEVGNHRINKRLTISDVNGSSRLLLPKDEIRKYVLPLMDLERSRACQSKDGLRVKIWDLDTGSEHELSLKQWKTGSFLLTSNWNTEFVNRRSLQEGDNIWLSWDSQNGRFLFHKLNAQS